MIKGSCKVNLQDLWDLSEAISKMIMKGGNKFVTLTDTEREELIHDVLINSGIFEAPFGKHLWDFPDD